MALKDMGNAGSELVPHNISKNDRLYFMACISFNLCAFAKVPQAAQITAPRPGLPRAMLHFRAMLF